MKQRAYSLFEVKSVDDEKGIIEGVATTPATDRMGDVVVPAGAQFKLPLPFLWQHDAKQPIGHVIAAKVSDSGISIRAQIRRDVWPEIERAWALIKSGLVRGLSIGFRELEGDDIKGTRGRRFTKWDWLELSAVTIPANSEASIQTIKSIDDEHLRAASGIESQGSVAAGREQEPAVAGKAITQRKERNMNVREQIASFEAKRASNVAAMAAIMEKSEGATLDSEQGNEYDGLAAEVKQIDTHIKRLRDTEAMLAQTAQPVPKAAGESEEQSIKVRRGEGVLRPNANLPKGIGMARYVKAIAFGKGNTEQARMYAKQWDESTPEVGMALKAAVSAGTTSDSAWAGPLVYNEHLASEYVEYLRPLTILGKIDGLRRVPFNVRYPTQTSGSTVGWVGQGLGKPVSELVFSSGSLGFAKAAGIVVITQELARFSSPSAELLVRDDLTAQMIYFLDQQFIDPGVAAVANVNPASILNGASNIRQAAATWTTMANVAADVKALMTTFATNEISLGGSYWVMTPEAALALSMLYTAGGETRAYPDITINGGTFYGIPVIVSNSVPHSTSAGSIVALIKASEIFLADDGGIAVDTSTEASLQMDSAPTQDSATPTASTVVSMFQTNSIAIRVERIINWSRRRTYGVGYIDNMHTS